MSKFVKVNLSQVIKQAITKNTVFIYKFKKAGTKRIFFAPELEDGTRLSSTMYGAKWEAVNLAKSYLKSKR